MADSTADHLPQLDKLAADVLTTEQWARVVALRAANQVLAGRGAGHDPIDLVSIARYIEHGLDPWDEDNAREAGEGRPG